MRVSTVAKTIVAGIVAVLGALVPLMSDDALSIEEVVQIALFILGAFGVYVTPNSPKPPRLNEDPETGTQSRI